MYHCNFDCILNPTLGHRRASAVGAEKLSGHREEGHLDGLWHPRSGVDRSRLLPVVCQRGLCTLRNNVIDRDLHQKELRTSPSVQIVNSYKTDKKLGQMLQNVDVYVTPVINVDGYNFTWSNETVSASTES